MSALVLGQVDDLHSPLGQLKRRLTNALRGPHQREHTPVVGAVGLHVQHRAPGDRLGGIHQGVERSLIPLPADAEIGDAFHKLHHIVFPPYPLGSDSLLQLSADGLCRPGNGVRLYQLIRLHHQRVHHHVLLNGRDDVPDAVIYRPGGR